MYYKDNGVLKLMMRSCALQKEKSRGGNNLCIDNAPPRFNNCHNSMLKSVESIFATLLVNIINSNVSKLFFVVQEKNINV